MESNILSSFAADIILLTHALFVVFVIIGLILIVAGKLLLWSWVLNPWFRWAHLISISVVVLQSWLSVICPLTIWEMALRERAGDTVYVGSFISFWLESILYYRAPGWIFILCYTVFGALVLVNWFWVRPRPFTKYRHHDVV